MRDNTFTDPEKFSLNSLFGILRKLFSNLSHYRTMRGQTTVEYLLAIGVIAVAMALVLLSSGLFEALAELFDKMATKIARPYP